MACAQYAGGKTASVARVNVAILGFRNQQEIHAAAELCQQRLSRMITLGYNSKKYFLVYMSIALHRMRRGHGITSSANLNFISPATLRCSAANMKIAFSIC